MLTISASSMLPGWIAVMLAAPTMLVIAWHILSVQRSSLEIARRRLRIGNGLLMMFITALLAYALGMARVPDQPRTDPAASRAFVLLWSLIVGLLAIVVGLALLDALLTTRSGVRARRTWQRDMSAVIGEDSRRG